MGPIYCSIDQRIYLDPSFLLDFRKQLPACKSDQDCTFIDAFLIAREVGHHVQNLLGILAKIQQASDDRVAANPLQVRVELQADCLAGIWANRSNKKHHFLDPGAVSQAFRPAVDDHRQQWFMTGFKQGTLQACNTFNMAEP
jgi:uncharacterized protein